MTDASLTDALGVMMLGAALVVTVTVFGEMIFGVVRTIRAFFGGDRV